MPPTTEAPLPATALAVYVARQPIFDANDRRIAYELLYRDGPSTTGAGSSAAEDMCNEMAVNALLTIGLDRLTNGATAWINITREHFLRGLHRVFDPKSIVVELLETIEGDREVLTACEEARKAGYTLALDDYDGRAELDALLPFVSIVKIVVLNRTESQLKPLVQSLRNRGLTVLAECVETTAQLDMCRRIGCTLFQGYVFSRPETFAGRAMSVNQFAILKILGMLHSERTSESDLEDALRSNPTLAHALLRIVNSAAIGVRSVNSIPHAMRVVGRGALVQWLQVMLAATVASRSPLAHEAVEHALIRARFCELMTSMGGLGDPAAHFMVGLLSRLDALLGIPMKQVLERLPVSDDVRDALLLGTGRHAPVLKIAKAYEAAEWHNVNQNSPARTGQISALMTAYVEAAQWANERLSLAQAA